MVTCGRESEGNSGTTSDIMGPLRARLFAFTRCQNSFDFESLKTEERGVEEETGSGGDSTTGEAGDG